MSNDLAAALPHLRHAALQAPVNPTIPFSLAQCLRRLDAPEHSNEAEALLSRVLALAPQSVLAERIKQTNCRLARQLFRANAVSQPRMDVVAYCANALKAYTALDRSAQKQLLMEVATAGQKGLSIQARGMAGTPPRQERPARLPLASRLFPFCGRHAASAGGSLGV
jgi:hypothetical protein